MEPGLLLNIVVVVVLVLIGGFFSCSELAVVSLRESQVRALAAKGGRGTAVERLTGDTNRFLSAVQIGVTLSGFLASAFGGSQIAVVVAPWLEQLGLSEGVADVVALVVVTALVTYVSLVLGELVPKRLALQRSEGVSLFVAPILDRIAAVTTPVVWLLGRSTDAVGRLIGLDPKASREEVTEEELRDMVSSHEQLDETERRIVADVFDAADRRLSEVMVPRTEVDFLAADLDLEEAVAVVEDQPHSRYPVTGESSDDVLGFVHVRDLLTAAHRGQEGTVADLVRPVALLPGSKTLLPSLSEMRRSGRHLAVVVDEYGGTDGIVTLEDLVEELVGEIEDEYDPHAGEPRWTGAASGPVELDGLLHRDEVEEATGVELPEGPYETLAGFVMTSLGVLPSLGDEVRDLGHRFTVVEVDGRRPSRIRVEPLAQDGGGTAGEGDQDDAAAARGDRPGGAGRDADDEQPEPTRSPA